MRRRTSRASNSLNIAGTLRSPLSRWTSTSATLREGRLLLPAKMTSSISPPRIDLAEVSPMTQRSASTRLDLPQPFGPTMPVRPGAMTSSVASTKDLKPLRRSFVNWTNGALPAASGLTERVVDQLLEVIIGKLAGMHLALDDEGRGRVDLVLVARLLQPADDLVLERLVGEAG